MIHINLQAGNIIHVHVWGWELSCDNTHSCNLSVQTCLQAMSSSIVDYQQNSFIQNTDTCFKSNQVHSKGATILHGGGGEGVGWV